MRGFTILEIIIVISVFAILIAFSAPIALRFLGTQNLDDTTTTLVATLRQSHTQALFQRNDASFGVKFSGSSYTTFQGSLYAARVVAEDTTIILPTGITVSGLSEIVFAKRTGKPNVTGTLLIQSGTSSRSIQINSQGLIQ